jgi:hypothetical protein
MGMGFTGMVLGSMLAEERTSGGQSATGEASPVPAPSAIAKADSVIWLFMMGGVSQMESFDPKPALNRYGGQTIRATPASSVISQDNLQLQQFGPELRYDTRILPLQVGFRQRGQSGLAISDWWEHVGACADDLAIVRSMWTTDTEHSAVFQFNTGRSLRDSPQPSLGSWCSYGLGTLNRDLPRFVVMGVTPLTHQGGPGSHNGGYLGPEHDGVRIGTDRATVLPYRPERVHPSQQVQRRELELIQRLNGIAAAEYPNDPALTARIQSYELAFGMQTALPEVVDLEQETASTQALYGMDEPETRPLGEQCLIARRLVERGVRFIQIYHGGNPGNDSGDWDAHENLRENHTRMCRKADKPIAGLLRDLKRRGMLERTLVVFATEFGRSPNIDIRTPCGPMDENVRTGRDHHIYGFSAWLAGAGIKGGMTHGRTDELGFHAVENRHYVTDLHATVLHQLGLDSHRMQFPGQQRLAMDRGQVIREILS